MFDTEIGTRSTAVLNLCRARRWTIAAVESCTGGLVCAALTAVPGSSDVVAGGLVTYANEAKSVLAGVPEDLIRQHGAVSEPVARAMAEGGRAMLAVDLSVAITGVAGPGGGSAAKPVGLVHFACAAAGRTLHREHRFGDLGRDEIRRLSVIAALDLLRDAAR
jgi:nicotinamide-nucleotide amidase